MTKMALKLLISLFVFPATEALAASTTPRSIEPSPAEYQRALEHNLHPHRKLETKDEHLVRPVGDYEKFKYVLLSSTDYSNSEYRKIRELISRNLPNDVFLVVLTNASEAKVTQALYSNWISSDRLILATDTNETSLGFWARDAFPIPVINDQNSITLVAHQYYRPFYSQKAVAMSVGAKELLPRSFTFVGGNLIADEQGNCFSIDSYRMFGTTGEEIKNGYGCKTHTMLKHLAGIGDVDEVLKPLPNKRMLTTEPTYQPILEKMGYTVTLLPKANGYYRTYANTLIVNGVAFMPSFDAPNDDVAKAVYESFGYKVVKIQTNQLSDQMHGSVHCQTMAYPAMDLNQIFAQLQWRQLQL